MIELYISTIDNMDDEECLLSFPIGLLGFNSASSMQMVFPNGYGMLYEFPRKHYLSFSTHYGYFSFNMPICGIFKGEK